MSYTDLPVSPYEEVSRWMTTMHWAELPFKIEPDPTNELLCYLTTEGPKAIVLRATCTDVAHLLGLEKPC
jgi:hypothetical protein